MDGAVFLQIGIAGADERMKVASGTGPLTGVCYSVGSAVAKVAKGHRKSFIHAERTAGSVDNIALVTSGKVGFGIAPSNLLYQTRQGLGPWEGNRQREWRGTLAKSKTFSCSSKLNLKSIAPYLRRAEKIALMHNEDDIIMAPSEVEYLSELFGCRAKFNYYFDNYFFLPVVRAYKKILPDYAEDRVSDFYVANRFIWASRFSSRAFPACWHTGRRSAQGR